MKVNIGLQGKKKSTHVVPRTVTTTSQFGFLQPSLCRECAAQDHISLRNAAAVRLQPVVKPTYGYLHLKQYNSFVPMEDIWHPWSSFQAGQSFQGALSQYVPLEAPSVPIGFLSMLTLLCSTEHLFQLTSSSVDTTSGTLTFDSSNLSPIQSSTTTAHLQTLIGAMFQDIGLDSTTFSTVISNIATYYGSNAIFVQEYDVSQTFDVDSYDFIYYYKISGGATYLSCLRLTDRGKNLRKILLGLGLQLSLEPDDVNVLALGAYYKVWFDCFAPQRNITWKDTYFYSWMEYIEQSGSEILTMLNYNSRYYEFLKWFTSSLPNCYYTQNPDWVSAHIVDSSILGTPEHFSYLESENEDVTFKTVSGEGAALDQNADAKISQVGLNILQKMYNRVNVHTALGGKIAEFMRAIFGADYFQENESNFLGASNTDIDISAVMSTAQTSEGELGEYAGKGEGFQNGENASYEFTCKTAGYLISMFCLVPDARFAQGVDPNWFHVKPKDFYQPDFDSITLLPSRKLSVFGDYDTKIQGVSKTGGFGNIPNYMEYKTSFDTVNGDISLRSTRGSLLPFSMAKLLPYPTYYKDEETDPSDPAYTIGTGLLPSTLVAGTIWRYIGRQKWIGNFDRIFINSGDQLSVRQQSSSIQFSEDLDDRLDDNFVCWLYHDMKVTGYELAVGDSWQTDAFGDHLTVEKQ